MSEDKDKKRDSVTEMIQSKFLDERKIFLWGEVSDRSARDLTEKLLFLEATDPGKEITFYINSPGGSITAGMAILDTMNYIKAEVNTICIGQAASMGAVLLAAGAKGKRRALPHARVLIHQPLGGFRGQATDIEIHANEILRWKRTLNELLADRTGQPIEQIRTDTDRDKIMTAEEAVTYGIIDEVITRQDAKSDD